MNEGRSEKTHFCFKKDILFQATLIALGHNILSVKETENSILTLKNVKFLARNQSNRKLYSSEAREFTKALEKQEINAQLYVKEAVLAKQRHKRNYSHQTLSLLISRR